MTRYAEQTTVPSDRSRAEIERTLTRYGATTFTYGWTDGRAMIGFAMNDRNIRFVLPLPDRLEFLKTATGKDRTPSVVTSEHAKAERQGWRALALMVKAKLEAVEAGIVTFEEEFLPHTVLPSGRTVFEEISPAVNLAYASNSVIPLQIEGARRG